MSFLSMVNSYSETQHSSEPQEGQDLYERAIERAEATRELVFELEEAADTWMRRAQSYGQQPQR